MLPPGKNPHDRTVGVEEFVEVARAHDIAPAQAVLAWHVARGSVAIPKASSLEHQKANLAAASITLDEAEVEAITSHSFTPIRKLNWRNHELKFGTIDTLVGSLEKSPDNEWLMVNNPAYVEQIQREYTGLWRRRFLEAVASDACRYV